MSAHAAPVTVRAVSAWAKSAQFETQQFLEFVETIQCLRGLTEQPFPME